MNFDGLFSLFLMFCILQTLISVFLLTLKKYRKTPNVFLMALFSLFLIHYFFYFFEYQGYFNPDHFKASAIMPFQLIPPIFIYFYLYSKVHQEFAEILSLYRHLIIFFISIVLFVPIVADSFPVDNTSVFFRYYSHSYKIIFSLVIAALYVIYAHKIVAIYAEAFDIKDKNFINTLFSLPKRIHVVIPVVALFFFSGFCFLLDLVLSILFEEMRKFADALIACNLFAYGAGLTYNFLNNPKTVD